MSLSSGARLGSYEIIGPIGAGGMGEVYRARDTKLQRDVAIKVLPDLFARDPERLTRFMREAQALAALNHPGVAQVFGVLELQDAGGSHAMVMEFVDGEDLAQRVSRGPVPIDEATEIALQIARGLEAAHERGIVHRDLKPANVRITPDGTVKVLDFGLAKALDPAASGSMELLNSPTFTSPATELGMIMGTAAYMAPEQARGKPVDKRADIWAFGCVVYEMLAAKQPFGGETVTDTLAAIVKEEVDWRALPSSTPPALRRLIDHCLVKDPKQRLRDIGDARIALERIVAGSPEDQSGSRPVAPGAGQGRFGMVHMLAAIAAVALIASLATWRLARPGPAPAPPVARFVTLLASDALSLRSNGGGVAFSPDGASVVYAAQPALLSAPVLYRRRLNGLEVERLPGTEGALAPFFSADSRWIGFFTDKGVMKLPLDGGAVSKICDRGTFSRADWAADGTIVLGTSQIYAPGALGRVPASGGTPVPLTTLAGKETLHQAPHLLPDGRHVVFTVLQPGRSELAIAPIDGGAHELLNVEGSGGMFVPPGHLLFARGDLLYTVAFDPSSRRVSGSPSQVLDDAGVFAGGVRVWHPLAGVDRAGSIAYLNKGGSTSVLGWMTPASAMTPIAIPAADYRTPVLSPDARLAAVTAGAAPPDIWVVNLERATRLRLTSSGGSVPIWSPDGSRIAYSSPDTGLMSIAADGGGTPEVMLPRQDGKSVAPTSWSPDGKSLVVTAEDRAAGGSVRNRDIWIVRPGEKPQPVLASPADERGGVVSRDGRWLAYASGVSGREEIYLRSFTGTGGTIPVSTDGGTLPRWSLAGDALYFLASGPRLMRATVKGNPPEVGAPSAVMTLPATIGGLDIAADGRVLLVMQKDDTAARDALHILLNWGYSLR